MWVAKATSMTVSTDLWYYIDIKFERDYNKIRKNNQSFFLNVANSFFRQIYLT